MFLGSGRELPLSESRLPSSKVRLDSQGFLLSPGCHPHDHARLQELFRYVFPAVHFNSAKVSGTRMKFGQPRKHRCLRHHLEQDKQRSCFEGGCCWTPSPSFFRSAGKGFSGALDHEFCFFRPPKSSLPSFPHALSLSVCNSPETLQYFEILASLGYWRMHWSKKEDEIRCVFSLHPLEVISYFIVSKKQCPIEVIPGV